MAGSTHPGEEEVLLEIFSVLNQEFPSLRLMIAPRHIERVNAVMSSIERHGFVPKKFSLFSKTPLGRQDIVVVDTIGHLRSLYGLAKVVFVGKSLKARGGQNIIEPAALGKPIFVGPHMENFQNILEIFLEAQAIIQVHNEKELLQEMQSLLRNPSEIHTLGERAQTVVRQYQGATEKTFQIIAKILSHSSANA